MGLHQRPVSLRWILSLFPLSIMDVKRGLLDVLSAPAGTLQGPAADLLEEKKW